MKPQSLPFPEDWGDAIRNAKDDSERDLTLIWLILQNAVFGIDWMKEHILEGKKGGFLRFEKDRSNAMEVNIKLLILAESIFNLNRYNIFGLEQFISVFKDDPTEGRFAELNLAVAMARTGCKFRFHHPAKPPIPGDNYDYEVVLPDGMLIPVEAKCRLEGSIADEEKIYSKLKKAAAKLPAGRPGAVLIQVPIDWISDVPAALDKAVYRLFKNYSRIVSLIAMGQYKTPHLAGIAVRYRHKDFHSVLHAFDKVRVWNIFESGIEPSWYSIQEMVEFYAPQA